MEMHDPSLLSGGENKDSILNNAAAREAEVAKAAGTDTADVDAPATESQPIDTDAEAEAELLMSQGEEEAETVTAETLMEKALALMARDAAEISTDGIRRLRQQYLALRKAESNAETETAVDANDEFMLIIERLKTKKAEWAREQEAVRATNLERKNAIIAEINALAEDTDNVNRTFPRYRELQDEFNAIGDVEPMEETGVWKRFQEAREHYSDNLKINKELRDYDFKKNLAEKEALLERAKALVEDEDVIAAYRRLQELHDQWRRIGPVAKELREEIWNSFREASAEINKRYQAFFEARKARENENEIAKTALCTRIESLDLAGLHTFAAWEDTTRHVMEVQAEWRTLGYASKKMNRQLFARFRRACDAFFAAKAEFYRNTRDELAANLAHKQQLVERAESLKDSTDWRAATDAFIEMQKEWKTIGAIPKKYSDDLWKRFTAACDHFFEQKKQAGSGQRAAENANLRTKRDIIARIQALLADAEANKNEVAATLRSLQQSWQETGHVPFREKDKLFDAYRDAVNEVRNRFALAEQRARRRRFEESVANIEGDNDKLYRERERLVRALEARRRDLATYENNLGFLSSKSKSGDSLMRDMERRIERLKADIAEVEEKISLIDAKL